jgi:hypothetical protein
VRDGTKPEDQEGGMRSVRYISWSIPMFLWSARVGTDIKIIDYGFSYCVRPAALAIWPADMRAALNTCASSPWHFVLRARIWYAMALFL